MKRAPKGAAELQKLVEIVLTAVNCGHKEPAPLRVIITHNDVEPVAVEGVRWVLDARYYNEDFEWS